MSSFNYSPEQKDQHTLLNLTRPLYSVRTLSKPFSMEQNVGTWFTTTHTINQTPEDLFVYPAKSRDNKPFSRIPTVFKDPSKIIFDQRLIIKATNHSGGYFNMGNFGSDTLEVEYTEIVISYKDLMEDAVYVPELDMVFAIEAHLDRMELVYPNSKKYIEQIKEIAAKEWYNENTNSPIVIEANDTTGTIKELFLVLNGFTISAPVTHEPKIKSFVEIRLFYRGKMHCVKCDPLKVFDKFETMIINETPWIIGKAEFHVKDQYLKYIRESRSCITQADVDLKCKEVEDLYTERIDALEHQIKNLKIENTNQKHVIDQHKSQVHATHDERKWHIESTMLERNSELEYRNKVFDQKIAELKVEKEKHSAASSEVGMITNVIKGALVVVPILATIYIATKSAAAGLAVAAVSGITKTIGSICCSVFSWFW